MDSGYIDRLVEAFTELQRRERRTDLDYAEITRRLSARLGREVKSQTVGRWMRGKVQPRDAEERRAFAEVLGVPVSWLFYNERTGGQPFAPPANATGHRSFPDPDAPATPAARPRRGRAAGDR